MKAGVGRRRSVGVVMGMISVLVGSVRACQFDEPPPVVPDVRARAGGPAGDLCVWWKPPNGYDATSPLSYTLLYVSQIRGTPLIGPLLTVPCDDGVASGLVTDTPTGACSATINNLDSTLRFTVQVIANSCAGSGPPSASTQPRTVSERNSICEFRGDNFNFSPPPPPPPRPPGPAQPPPPAPPFQCGVCDPGTVLLEECVPPPAPEEPPTTSLGPSGTACLSFNISYPFPDGPAGPIDGGFLNVTGVTVQIRPFGSPADTVRIEADVQPGDAESSVILDTDATTGNLLGLISIGGLDDGVPYNFVYALDNCAAQSGFSPATDFLVPLPAQEEPSCPNPFVSR